MMSMQGTWADHMMIQAVADAINFKIYVIESSQNFVDMTESLNQQLCRKTYRGDALCCNIHN